MPNMLKATETETETQQEPINKQQPQDVLPDFQYFFPDLELKSLDREYNPPLLGLDDVLSNLEKAIQKLRATFESDLQRDLNGENTLPVPGHGPEWCYEPPDPTSSDLNQKRIAYHNALNAFRNLYNAIKKDSEAKLREHAALRQTLGELSSAQRVENHERRLGKVTGDINLLKQFAQHFQTIAEDLAQNPKRSQAYFDQNSLAYKRQKREKLYELYFKLSSIGEEIMLPSLIIAVFGAAFLFGISAIGFAVLLVALEISLVAGTIYSSRQQTYLGEQNHNQHRIEQLWGTAEKEARIANLANLADLNQEKTNSYSFFDQRGTLFGQQDETVTQKKSQQMATFSFSPQ